jgi:hypothetical protein
MFIAVKGRLEDGTRGERSWHLIAEGDDGPYDPTMACAAIVQLCRAGRRPEPGARSAIDDIGLDDYDVSFSRFAMTAGVREAGPTSASLPLYRRLLGEAWYRLPEPVNTLHDLDDTMVVSRRACIERGPGVLAWIAATLFRFPRAGRDVSVEVTLSADKSREVWRRRFAGHNLRSVQWQGRGRSAYLLREQFGPAIFSMALVVDGERLRLALRRWSIFGVVLSLALAPRGEAYEFAEDGRFRFHGEIKHPLTGLIVRYRGRLEPQPAAASGLECSDRPRAPGTVA